MDIYSRFLPTSIDVGRSAGLDLGIGLTWWKKHPIRIVDNTHLPFESKVVQHKEASSFGGRLYTGFFVLNCLNAGRIDET